MSTEYRPLRLMDTFRNLFYTPIYVAVAGGFFYAEGLNVEFGGVPDGQSAMGMLRSGAVDIVQTGISRSLMDLDEGKEDAPLHIAEINQRDGFFLLSRKPVENWTWKDLEGSSLIPIGFTPVPWNPLRSVLKSNGVDLDAIELIGELSAVDAIDRFRNEQADYLHILHPFAQTLIEGGIGHMAAAMGPELGYICYSSFAALPSFIDENPDTVQAFVIGFDKALRWVAGNDESAIAERVSPFFPDVSPETLARGIAQYKKQETWPQDALIGGDGFDSMRDILIDGGLVTGSHPYQRLVRPEFAKNAMDA
ncbi:MAG: ABC transporter substrate-binding protein [SAR202 cluster bacterium]|nr:ABC transporter substrate-binding protein [SAR202 cluster bacterium]